MSILMFKKNFHFQIHDYVIYVFQSMNCVSCSIQELRYKEIFTIIILWKRIQNIYNIKYENIFVVIFSFKFAIIYDNVILLW